MKYKNIKVLYISLVVYLGEEFKNNSWRDNTDIFREKIKDLSFKVGFGLECPIEDLIEVQIDYKDDLEPLARMDTMDKIFSVANELLKVFGDKVKVNIYLDSHIEGEGNSIDMTIIEFIKWICEELRRYNTTNDC